jgi:hypothetical protein
MAAWRTVATSEGGGCPCRQVSSFGLWQLLAVTQHNQSSYTVHIHAAIGSGGPRWQPLSVAVAAPQRVMSAERSLAAGNGNSGVQLRPIDGGASSSAGGRAPATWWWRLLHCAGFYIFLFVFVFFVFGLFRTHFANIPLLNRRFHSNQPVKFDLPLFKILCSFS